MTELHYRTATEVAAAIARAELSADEVADNLRRRVEALNPRVNAIVETSDTDSESEGPIVDGQLSGVPVTVKDAIAVAGMRTTWGNPQWANGVADRNAVLVDRVRAAGAPITGKTNVALMLEDFGQTSNPLFGTTNNPWNLERAAGGSSGGSAAAVAAGLSYLDFGSDVVGSVRIPAAMCGVYGLRPTAGLIPLDGFQPPGPPAAPTLLDDLAVLGPLARSAADIRVALTAAAGPALPAAQAYRWRLPPPRRERLADFRVGVVLDDASAAPTAEVGAVLSNLVDGLSSRVANIVPGWPAEFDVRSNGETFGGLLQAFFAFKQSDAEDAAPVGRLIELDVRRRRLQTIWTDYFRDVDVLLCPTTCATATPHDDRPIHDRTFPSAEGDRSYHDLAGWVAPATVAGLPALSVPAGCAADGLPVGLQVIGPRYEDDTVITFAELLAGHVAVGYRPPPL